MQEEHFEAFAALISGIHGNIQKIKSSYAASLGLKTVQVFWLYLLRAHPEGMTASELARSGKTDRSLVSREIGELQKKGIIVARTHGQRRRYGWKFVLTEQGEQIAQRISRIALSVQERVNDAIPEEDLLVFYRTMNRLGERFDEIVKEISEDERTHNL